MFLRKSNCSFVSTPSAVVSALSAFASETIVSTITIFLFSFYPPFHLMSLVTGGVMIIIGLILKGKKKEKRK